PPGPHPTGPGPGPSRIKRRKTKRERDTAKFGRKVPSGRQRGAGLPPRRLLPLWGGRPPASPLPAPKTIVITQNRLCQHQGMFNREVKSVNVERLLSPCPGQDLAPPSKPPHPRDPSPAPEGDPHPSEQDPLPSSPQAPQTEGEKGVPAELPLRELASRLRAILGHTMAFPGRDLVGERRQAILAALLHRHRALPDLSLLLAHRNQGTDAAPPGTAGPGGCGAVVPPGSQPYHPLQPGRAAASPSTAPLHHGTVCSPVPGPVLQDQPGRPDPRHLEPRAPSPALPPPPAPAPSAPAWLPPPWAAIGAPERRHLLLAAVAGAQTPPSKPPAVGLGGLVGRSGAKVPPGSGGAGLAAGAPALAPLLLTPLRGAGAGRVPPAQSQNLGLPLRGAVLRVGGGPRFLGVRAGAPLPRGAPWLNKGCFS
uniref:Uncharacterized protein n=1 Tax=Accipiter nisus TaxID=211598 RepID=A0A8B9N555_9AVES